jgi:hypothetical protein
MINVYLHLGIRTPVYIVIYTGALSPISNRRKNFTGNLIEVFLNLPKDLAVSAPHVVIIIIFKIRHLNFLF